MDEVTQPIVFFLELSHDAIDFSAIDGFQVTPGCIGEHFFSQTTNDQALALHQHLLEFHDVGDLLAVLDEDLASLGIDELFGERIGKEQRAILARRYDRRSDPAPVLSERRTGAIYAPAIVAASEALSEVPRHNFHPLELDGEDDD